MLFPFVIATFLKLTGLKGMDKLIIARDISFRN